MEWLWFVLLYPSLILIPLFCLCYYWYFICNTLTRVNGDALAVNVVDKIDNSTKDEIRGKKAPGISYNGLKTLDETKTGVEAASKTSINNTRRKADQVLSTLSEAKIEDERKRSLLLDEFRKAQDFLSQLNENRSLPLLQVNITEILEDMKQHISQLEQKEYYILVAGEASAGKSSLINLILGERLLPSSSLSTTSTLCELKYGEERKIVAHLKDTDSKTGLTSTIFLENPTESSGKSYLQQISPFVHVKGADRGEGTIYKKVEIFWPHQLLKKGVTIIDSPGVGESEVMDEVVTEYLPQAFGFIYVINSANAGGVQKDRLVSLLSELGKISRERQEEFPSKCALFVCNKWDQIPEDEADDVKAHIKTKLTEWWPDLIPETQITYISVKNALGAQSRGKIKTDFITLMNGIRIFVLKCIEQRLGIHWRWLDFVFYQLICQTKMVTMNATRDHKKVNKNMTTILYRLEVLERQQTQLIDRIRIDMTAQANEVETKLCEFLNSEDLGTQFIYRFYGSAPSVSELDEELQVILQQWEDKNHVFANAFSLPLQRFLEQHNLAKMQILNLQRDISEGEVSMATPIYPNCKFSASVVFIFDLFAERLGIFRSISGSMGGLDTIMPMLKNFTSSVWKRKSFLQCVINGDAAKSMVNKMLKKHLKRLEQIGNQVPQMIQANKKLCEELRDNKQSHQKIIELYEPIRNSASAIRGHLAAFGLREACAHCNEELQWKDDASAFLGCGMFASVYKGKMRRHGFEQKVAVKVCRKPLDVENASLAVEEMTLLRKLDHPHIVKFFGTALLKKEDGLRLIFVMERCTESLKDHIFKHRESVPGLSGKTADLRVCRWAKEITAGLHFMHEVGIIHRDLKLENILLSEEDSVRIGDVGVSKEASKVSGTVKGSFSYMAPEVFHSKLYDFKADIYSFGIMLWEMWFGRRAFAEVEALNNQHFFSLVDHGRRPKDIMELKKPPRRWKELMERCWDRDPEKRPTADNCEREMTEICSGWTGH